MDDTVNDKVNSLIINAFADDNIGLMYGRTGYALTLYIASKNTEEAKADAYRRFADHLLSNVLTTIPHNFNFSFADGLCGIGWAVEYLINRGFVEGESGHVLEDLDNDIMIINPRRIGDGLQQGMKGLLHYVLLHISNCVSQGARMPFDNMFLKDLYSAACERVGRTADRSLLNLCGMYIRYMDNHSSLDYNYGVEICYNDSSLDTSRINEESLSLAEGICKYILLKSNIKP